MTIALEPMVLVRSWQTRVMPDEWTVASADGGLTAHFEHSIAVTENGPFILTAPDEESTTLSGRNKQQQV
jgi:methionyl aminopeptidase